MLPVHVRVAEVLRVVDGAGGVARMDVMERYEELARRGVLDPEMHFERYRGALRPTPSAKVAVGNAVEFCADGGLLEPFRPDDGRYKRTWMITKDGRETLNDWDDTTSDGIYSGSY